jgi:hypothetical protein
MNSVKKEEVMENNRIELFKKMQRAIAEIDKTQSLAGIAEDLFGILLQLPWVKMSKEAWATVDHNSATWLFSMGRMRGSESADQFIFRTLAGMEILGKDMLCSVTALKEDMTEHGLVPPIAKIKRASEIATDVYRDAQEVKKLYCIG